MFLGSNMLMLMRLFRTKDTFVDGYVHTGDEVLFNEEGELFIIDRLKVLWPRPYSLRCFIHTQSYSSRSSSKYEASKLLRRN